MEQKLQYQDFYQQTEQRQRELQTQILSPKLGKKKKRQSDQLQDQKEEPKLTEFEITTTLLAKQLNSFTLLSQVFRSQGNEYLEQQATKKSEEVSRKILEKVRQNNQHNPAVEMEKFVAT